MDTTRGHAAVSRVGNTTSGGMFTREMQQHSAQPSASPPIFTFTSLPTASTASTMAPPRPPAPQPPPPQPPAPPAQLGAVPQQHNRQAGQHQQARLSSLPDSLAQSMEVLEPQAAGATRADCNKLPSSASISTSTSATCGLNSSTPKVPASLDIPGASFARMASNVAMDATDSNNDSSSSSAASAPAGLHAASGSGSGSADTDGSAPSKQQHAPRQPAESRDKLDEMAHNLGAPPSFFCPITRS